MNVEIHGQSPKPNLEGLEEELEVAEDMVSESSEEIVADSDDAVEAQPEPEATEDEPMLREKAGLQATDIEAGGNDGHTDKTNGEVHHPESLERPSTPPTVVTTQQCTKPPSSSCITWAGAKKGLVGVAIGLSVAISWVAATQFMKSMYSEDFQAPFFVIWFSTAWMVVCYPIYIVGSFVIFKDTREGGIKALFRDDQLIYGSAGMTIWRCLRLTGPFCALWMITNYMYVAALKLKSPTDVTSIFVTNTAFIYIFSWIWLVELLVLLPARVCSVILSVVGTVLMMSSGGFGGGSIVGALLAVGSAIGAALYKVLFKRFLGDATYGQVSLFLTMLGVINTVFLWPIILGLYYTDKEVLDWQNLPWAFLCGTSALGIVFNFLVNFGIAITYPLLISLANIVGIPINAIIDTAFRGVKLGPLEIVGALLIILGFIIMLLPEHWQAKVACWKEGEEPCCRGRAQAEHIPDEDPDEVVSTKQAEAEATAAV